MRIINKHLIIIISIFITFGAFVFGYSLVSMSMKAQVISQKNSLTSNQRDYQLSIITTLLPLGAFIGSFFTNSLVNKIGERKAMMVTDVFAFFVITCQSNFLNLTTLYITRFSLGLYLGVSSGIIPSYLVSISPPQMTGLIGSFNQLLITVGISVAYKFGMSQYFSWFSYIQLPAYFCLLRFLSLFFFKFDNLERHYHNNDLSHLKNYVELFYENGSVQQLEKLRKFTKISSVSQKKQKNVQNKSKCGSFDSFIGGVSKKVFLMGVVLAFANQFSGINAIIYYAKQIFEHISNSQKALEYTYYLGLMQVAVTFFSGFMINKYGRRSLMLIGSSIICFSLISAFLCDAFISNSDGLVSKLIFLHVIGFSLSLGPVCMIYVAQLMADISFFVVLTWILTIVVSLFSQVFIKSLGIGKVFLFYGMCSLFCLVYMYQNMVESKGLSRQQLVARIQSNPIFRSLEDEKTRLHDQGSAIDQIS